MSFEQEINKEEQESPIRGKLQVHTSFFPLAWILHAVSPVIEINGKRVNTKWGSTEFNIDPGNHNVKIYFPYMFISHCGANTVNIDIEAGKTKRINYYMPGWMLAKGRIKVLD